MLRLLIVLSAALLMASCGHTRIYSDLPVVQCPEIALQACPVLPETLPRNEGGFKKFVEWLIIQYDECAASHDELLVCYQEEQALRRSRSAGPD